MEHLIFTSYIIFIASDTTAGLFLIILILSIAVQSEKRQELAHLLSASILILAGIFLRLLACSSESQAVQEAKPFGLENTPLILISAFMLITIGVTEAANSAIYVNEGIRIRGLRGRYAVTAIIIAVGAILYTRSGSIFRCSLRFRSVKADRPWVIHYAFDIKRAAS